MGFPRQEYRSGLPFPSPGDLPEPEIEPESPALAGGLSHQGSPVPQNFHSLLSAEVAKFLTKYICIYLAAPGLSCGMWDLLH